MLSLILGIAAFQAAASARNDQWAFLLGLLAIVSGFWVLLTNEKGYGIAVAGIVTGTLAFAWWVFSFAPLLVR